VGTQKTHKEAAGISRDQQGSISSCSAKRGMMLDPQTQCCQIFIEWPWLPWPAEVQGLGLASSRVLDLPRNNENLPIKHGRYFN